MTKKKVKIKQVAIVIQFTDGTCRNALIKQETLDSIVSLIYEMEGKIKVCDTVLEGITLE